MRKFNIFLALTLLVFTYDLFAQTAYYDAVYLFENKVLIDKLIKSVNAYEIKSKEKLDLSSEDSIVMNFDNDFKSQLLAIGSLNRNHFDSMSVVDVKSFSMKLKDYKDAGILGFGYGGLLGVISGLTNFSGDQKNVLIDGFVKYANEEGQKGFVISYVEFVEKTIGSIGELQLLFPKTYKMIHDHDPLKFGDLGNEWKQTFNDDLSHLIDNLIAYMQNSNDISYRKLPPMALMTSENMDLLKLKPEFSYLCIFADIGNKLINRMHFVNLINALDLKYYPAKKISAVNDDFGNLIHGINIIQSNLRDTGSTIGSEVSTIWINFEKFKKLQNPDILKLFVRLVYLQHPTYWSTINKFPDTESEIDKFYNETLIPIFEILIKIQQVMNNKEVKSEEYSDYMQLVLDFVKVINNFPDREFLDNKTFEIAQTSLDIYKSIHSKDYLSIIDRSVLLLRYIGLFDIKDIEEELIKVLASYKKIGELAVGIVNAKNSDESKQVISKFVDPPTSYLEKRNSTLKVSLSTHPGLFTSYEKLEGKWGMTSGITLPVGIEISFGFGSKNTLLAKVDKESTDRKSSDFSIGLFLQVVDLGSILNFRLNDDSSSTLPGDIKLAQIYSLGGSLNIGFPNRSLTLGLGYQRTPELREVTKDGLKIMPKGDRLFLRLSIDLPLFIF